MMWQTVHWLGVVATAAARGVASVSRRWDQVKSTFRGNHCWHVASGGFARPQNGRQHVRTLRRSRGSSSIVRFVSDVISFVSDVIGFVSDVTTALVQPLLLLQLLKTAVFAAAAAVI